MSLSRRQMLAAVPLARALGQSGRGAASVPRATPAVCLYSQALIKIPYDELGPVLRELGADGCDLSVFAGGHVRPENAGLDLMRAVEAITGVGLEVPVISTKSTSLADPAIRTVAAVCGEMGLPLFRAGEWKYTAAEPEARLGEVQRDIAGLAALARAVKMSVAIQNIAGDNVGSSLWDLNMVLRGMDASVGYDFDIGYGAAGVGPAAWPVTLRMARPRLKMVTVRDFIWSKDSAGAWKYTPCPLGEGMVEFPKFFAALAGMKFAGPISVQIDYQPKDDLGAVKRDMEFVRKMVKAAYGA